MISFFLTTKCNLECVYCYNSQERLNFYERSLSIDIAKAGIDYFFKTNDSRHIRFYGPGEPTQEFLLMQKITDYARLKAGDKLSVEIQTNGVFDNEIREWMLNNINIIWISFDGEPEIQNANRPIRGGHPSSSIIENNIQWLLEKQKKNFMTGARVTISEINVHRQIELVDYFYELGIRHIWSDPLFPSVHKKPVCSDPNRQKNSIFDMDTYVTNFVRAYHHARKKNIFYGSFLTCNFDGITNKHCRACTPVPHLTPDGYVSACDLVTFGEHAFHMDCFVYGKWNEKTRSFIWDQEKIYSLQNRSINNLQHCKKCKARFYCGGYCLGEVVNETGSLYGRKLNACKAIKRLLDELGNFESLYEFPHP